MNTFLDMMENDPAMTLTMIEELGYMDTPDSVRTNAQAEMEMEETGHADHLGFMSYLDKDLFNTRE